MQHSSAATFSQPALDGPSAPRPGSDRMGSPWRSTPVPWVASKGRSGFAEGESALAGLAGSDLSRRFRHWRGISGRRHLFSVFPVRDAGTGGELPRFSDAVVLAVGPGPCGERRILMIDDTGADPGPFYDGARLRAALTAGADEIHVHLLTESRVGRAALIRDLAAG